MKKILNYIFNRIEELILILFFGIIFFGIIIAFLYPCIVYYYTNN